MSNEYEFYTEYGYRGRGSASAIVIPIQKLDDNEVEVIYKSYSAKLKNMSEHRLNELISNSTLENENISLVKQKEINEKLCNELVDEMRNNGGRINGEDYKDVYNRIQSEI